MKSAKFWNLRKISSTKQQRISKDDPMEKWASKKLSERSWVSLAVDRVHYLIQLGVDDEKILASVYEKEPHYFWNTQRRMLVELMVAEYRTTTHEGIRRNDLPF